LSLSADTFEATVAAGDLKVLFAGTVRVGAAGVQVLDGSGSADIAVVGGDLELTGTVLAAGGIRIDISDGALKVLAGADGGNILNADKASIVIELGAGVVVETGERIQVLAGEFSATTT